jgi:CRP/FNR family transcriptional regulator, cyclic AMP receptor protein
LSVFSAAPVSRTPPQPGQSTFQAMSKRPKRAACRSVAFDPDVFLATLKRGRTTVEYQTGQFVFSQGDVADAVFYVARGKIKIFVVSEPGREAVVAMLGEGDFFGEGCLIAQPLRLAAAASMTDATVMRIEKTEMIRVLHVETAFAEAFTTHLLTRNSRTEADLVDHLLNSSEKRLARTLLLLANFGKEGRPEPITTKISQETLADMIGTTRPRVSFFMNKFRKLGFIEYNGKLQVHSSLLSVILRDSATSAGTELSCNVVIFEQPPPCGSVTVNFRWAGEDYEDSTDCDRGRTAQACSVDVSPVN